MGKGKTTFILKFTIVLIGIIVYSLCIFWLPILANDTAERFPEYAYLKFPVLIGLYVTLIPFSTALYQALKLLSYIDSNNVFSVFSVKHLTYIKYCAVAICAIYVTGILFLLTQNALHPGIAIIGFVIVFVSVVIAVFISVLHKMLLHVFVIKMENELTV